MSETGKRVFVHKIKKQFHLTQVCGNEESLTRWTIAPDVNRPGLELSGYMDDTELKRVVVIGKKEQKYLKNIDYETQKKRFDFLTDSYTPCIIVTGGYSTPPALIEVASAKNFPVFEFPGETYQLTIDLTAYLSNRLAPSEDVHGGMMSIYGIGVLIMGASGIGKSELALDLIKRGHIFIADDLVEVTKKGNQLSCESPDNLKRMLEVRGIGVIDVNVIFGGHCFLPKCNLDFVIKLVKLDDYTQSNPDRLNPLENRISFMGIKKPILEIPVTEGKSMSVIVETAVANYIMKKQGVDTLEIFKQRILNDIASKE